MKGNTRCPLRKDTWKPCIPDHDYFQDNGSFGAVEDPLLSESSSRCGSPSHSLAPLLYQSPPSNPPQNDKETLELYVNPSIDSIKPRSVLCDPTFLGLIEKSGASSASPDIDLARQHPNPGDFAINHDNISRETELAFRETKRISGNDSIIAKSFKTEGGGPTYLVDLDDHPRDQFSSLFRLDTSVGNTSSSVEQMRFTIWNLFPNAYGLPCIPWSQYGVVPDLLNMDLHSLYLPKSLEGKLPDGNKLVPKFFEAGFCAKEFSLASRYGNESRPAILRYKLCGNIGQFEAFTSHEKQHEISQEAWNELCSAVLHALAPTASRRLSFERLASDFFSGNPVLDDDSYEKAINEKTPKLNQQEDADPRATIIESKAYVISHQGSEWSEFLKLSTKNDGSLVAFLLDIVKCNNLEQCSKKSSMRYCGLRVRRELKKVTGNPIEPCSPSESLLDNLAEDELAQERDIKFIPKGDVVSSQTPEPLSGPYSHLVLNWTIASDVEPGVEDLRRSTVMELGELAGTSSTEDIHDYSKRNYEAFRDVDGSSKIEQKENIFGPESQLNIGQGTSGIIIGEPTSGFASDHKADTNLSNTLYNDRANLAILVEQSGGYASASDSLPKDKLDMPNHQHLDTKTRAKNKKKHEFKKQKNSHLSSNVDTEMNRPGNVAHSTFSLFSQLEMTSFASLPDIDDGGDWSVVQPRSSRKASGFSQPPGKLSSDPKNVSGIVQGSLTSRDEDAKTKQRQQTLPKGSSFPALKREIIKSPKAVQTHKPSGSQAVISSSSIHTHNIVSVNVSNQKDAEKTRVFNEDEYPAMPSESMHHTLVKRGSISEPSTKLSPESPGTSNREQKFEAADILHLGEGVNVISLSCPSLKHTLPQKLTTLTRTIKEPKESKKFEDLVENVFSTPSNRGVHHNATNALKSDESSEILAGAQAFTSSSCAIVHTGVQNRGELGNGDYLSNKIAPIKAAITACGITNGQFVPDCSPHTATNDHKLPECPTHFQSGGDKVDETEKPVGSSISPQSEGLKLILSAHEDTSPRPTTLKVRRICKSMSVSDLQASSCQQNIGYRRTVSENAALGEFDDAFAECSSVNEDIAGSKTISTTVYRTSLDYYNNEASHAFTIRSEGFSGFEDNDHAHRILYESQMPEATSIASDSNTYARSSMPHTLGRDLQSNHWATPMTYHNQHGLTSQVTYAHALSASAHISTASPIANGSSSPGIHHRHGSFSKEGNTQYAYNTTSNLDYARGFALASYQRADRGSYHQKLMPYPPSEPPSYQPRCHSPSQFIVSCTYCNVMVVASSETPQVMCLGCGMESNIRYCSIACLQADAYDHSQSCAHWPTFQKITYCGLPNSLHADSLHQEDLIYLPSYCSNSAENFRRHRSIEAHPDI